MGIVRFEIEAPINVSRAFLVLVGLLAAAVSADDQVELRLARGPGAGEVTLSWTGGQPPFDVHRSQDVTATGDAATRVAQVADSTWIDQGTATPILYFNVVEICTRGTPGCGWREGQVFTNNQTDWGSSAHPAGQLLFAHYNAVYVTTFGIFEVGIPGAAGFSIQFTQPMFMLSYLPSAGTPRALTADTSNPISTTSGAFGGDVVALKLNIDFADAGITTGSLAVSFGDLRICGLSSPTAVNGMRIRDYLGVVNSALGGATPLAPIPDLFLLAVQLNFAFEGGSPSTFAQNHIVNGACPP